MQPTYLDDELVDTPSLALERARYERMAKTVEVDTVVPAQKAV